MGGSFHFFIVDYFPEDIPYNNIVPQMVKNSEFLFVCVCDYT